jgi:hypothetical protein
MDNELDNSLAGIFEVTKEEKRSPVLINQSPETSKNYQAEADVEYVRANLYDLMGSGSEAISQMMQLAKESQHPRTYEVLSNFIKNMGDVGDKLIQLHKSKKELAETEEKTRTSSSGINVEQAVFVGSTADLLKKIKENAG